MESAVRLHQHETHRAIAPIGGQICQVRWPANSPSAPSSTSRKPICSDRGATMDLTALLLSRIQFAFTISFHIIFPSFTIGLAAWLTVLEALHLATGRPAYRLVFEFWLKIFGVAFGLGVVSGIVMAFEFGTNWSELSRDGRTNPRAAARRTRPSPPSCPGGDVLRCPACSAGIACRHGSTCSRPRWWRSEPPSPPSGSWSTTAGCRCRSATSSRTASLSRTTGPRSSSVRWSGCAFLTCCSPPI